MDPYIGEIRIFGFNFAPVGWAFCAGQTLAIPQYSALFAVIGTNFGGNGTSNFQLPKLQAQVPLGAGNNPALGSYTVGQAVGAPPIVTLTGAQMPVHNHPLNAQNAEANSVSPAGNYLAKGGTQSQPHEPGKSFPTYAVATPAPPLAVLAPSVSLVGGGQPFGTAQPTLALNYCIALQGIFPPRS